MGATDIEANAVRQALCRLQLRVGAFHHALVHFSTELVGDIGKQRLDRTEVVVDGAAGHTGHLCQLADGYFADALFGKQLQGGSVQALLERSHDGELPGRVVSLIERLCSKKIKESLLDHPWGGCEIVMRVLKRRGTWGELLHPFPALCTSSG